MKKVYIKAITHIDPPEYFTSEVIESMISKTYEKLNLTQGRLEFITGVKRRGFWSSPIRPSDISILAGKKILKKNNHRIDLLINASVCRNCDEPSTASFVHDGLELTDSCESFDLSNACLGVMNAIKVAKSCIKAGDATNVLITSGENSRDLLKDTIRVIEETDISRKDLKKYLASLTIGSSGTAVLLGDTSEGALWEVGEIHSKSDSSAHKLCEGRVVDGALLMETNSEELLKSGIELAKRNFERFSDKKFDNYILHQVGSAHRKHLLDALGIKDGLDYSIFEEFGNSGSSAVITALSKALESEFVTKDNRIGLLGIGSGLHTLMMELVPCQ